MKIQSRATGPSHFPISVQEFLLNSSPNWLDVPKGRKRYLGVEQKGVAGPYRVGPLFELCKDLAGIVPRLSPFLGVEVDVAKGDLRVNQVLLGMPLHIRNQPLSVGSLWAVMSSRMNSIFCRIRCLIAPSSRSRRAATASR